MRQEFRAEFYRQISESVADGILVADTSEKKFVYANPCICKMTGYSTDELLNLSVTDIHPKEDLPYVLEQFKQQMEGKISLAEEIPILRKDKKVIYCDINSQPMKLGMTEYLIGVFRDITEFRKARKELKKRNEELEKFNNMVVDREMKMVELKKRIKELEARNKLGIIQV